MVEEEKEFKEKKDFIEDKGFTPFLNAFAVYIVTLIFAYVFAITFITIPEKNIRFADSALTFLLATALFTIITWGYRSSKAQIDKDKGELKIKQNGGGTDEIKPS